MSAGNAPPPAGGVPPAAEKIALTHHAATSRLTAGGMVATAAAVYALPLDMGPGFALALFPLLWLGCWMLSRRAAERLFYDRVHYTLQTGAAEEEEPDDVEESMDARRAGLCVTAEMPLVLVVVVQAAVTYGLFSIPGLAAAFALLPLALAQLHGYGKLGVRSEYGREIRYPEYTDFVASLASPASAAAITLGWFF